MGNWIAGIVIAGYGVASGTGNDRRYPAGTLRLQQPFFLEQGINLSPYFSGTLNVDLAPFKPVPRHPIFDGCIRWFEGIEERFILSPVEVEVRVEVPVEAEAGADAQLAGQAGQASGRRYHGLWYYPHPETKPAHQQKDTVVELLLPWIAGLTAGAGLLVRL